jgi:hypothetical protein
MEPIRSLYLEFGVARQAIESVSSSLAINPVRIGLAIFFLAIVAQFLSATQAGVFEIRLFFALVAKVNFFLDGFFHWLSFFGFEVHYLSEVLADDFGEAMAANESTANGYFDRGATIEGNGVARSRVGFGPVAVQTTEFRFYFHGLFLLQKQPGNPEHHSQARNGDPRSHRQGAA